METKLDINKIIPNPYHPEGRRQIDDATAEKFGKSILEFGLLQTPVCRKKNGHYEMGDGWLRLSGFQWLIKQGHKEFQEMPVDVRDLTDRQMADLVLEANIDRQDLNPIDKAKLFSKYLADFKCGQAELARAHNISQGELSNMLRLLDLPEEIQTKVISQEISEPHARTLLQLKNPKDMAKLATKAIERHTSVEDLDREIKQTLWAGTKPLTTNDYYSGDNSAFDLASCKKCKHRQMMKRPWSSGTDERIPRCTNRKCWGDKQKTALQETHKKQLDKLAAQEACQRVGWPLDGCYVREKTKKGGWKNITPEKNNDINGALKIGLRLANGCSLHPDCYSCPLPDCKCPPREISKQIEPKQPSPKTIFGKNKEDKPKMELKQAQNISQEIVEKLKPYCSKIEVAGSIRRKKQFPRDIDIVCIPSNQGQFIYALQQLGKMKVGGQKLIRLDLPTGVSCDVYIASPDTWATLLLIRTGSKEHNIRLCSLAKQKDMKLHADGSGLFKVSNDERDEFEERIAGDTEESIFQALGLTYLKPEERR